jgi:transcriptional antiterminator RfaH
MDLTTEINWYAVQAKANRESAAAMNIERLGLEVFLPRTEKEKLVRGARTTVTSALFPGYLFARFCPLRYSHLIRYARGVQRIVSCGEVPLPVADEIIRAIRHRIGRQGLVMIGPRRFEVGDRMLIREGPLRGITAVLDNRMDGRQRVELLIDAIEYQARVVVERHNLEAAS